MLVTLFEWTVGPWISAGWNYLAGNWPAIALYLFVVAIFCAAVRRLLDVYGVRPLIGGVVVLIVGAWMLGYSSAPVKTVVRTIAKPVVQSVEKIVVDNSMIDRLRKRIAALIAQKDSAIADAQAALEKAHSQLAAAADEIERLKHELANKPVIAVRRIDGTGQCPHCGHLMQVSEKLRNEQIRCRQCGLILSAKTAWAHRAYVLDHQR
jgi:hypothetical protein